MTYVMTASEIVLASDGKLFSLISRFDVMNLDLT